MSRPPIRRRRLTRTLRSELEHPALLVSSPANVRYLSGFGGEGLLLLGPEAVLCTDRRYEAEARRRGRGCRVVCHEQGHLAGARQTVQDWGLERTAFESRHLSYAGYQTLTGGEDAIPWTPTTDLVEGRRLIKEAGEVRRLARAAALADRVLADYLPRLRVGLTEKQAAWDLRRALVDGGAQDASFTPMVASGPNAARPHAEPTDRPLQEGEPVVVDLGARLAGYCSDLTRTVLLGRPSPEFTARYRAVQRAQQAAVERLAPGVPCREIDQAAREVLEAEGLGPQFSHAVGHGVGLEIHEGPRLNAYSQEVLAAGHVVTVEPGVYLEGWGGIRIEDLYAIVPGGARRLTRIPHLDL